VQSYSPRVGPLTLSRRRRFQLSSSSRPYVRRLRKRSSRGALREGKGESEGAFLLLDLSEAMVTFTHTATGEWYRVHLDGTFNEVKARRVEGSILEFRAVEAGQRFTVYDSAGNVVMRDRGAIKYRFLFDTGGDDEPGGEWLEFYDFSFAGQHEAGRIVAEGGPCALAEHLLG
jgi:hypothetical protein